MISAGQVSASGSAQSLCVFPPGPCTVVMSNTGLVPAYVGVAGSGSLTSTNGFPLPSGGLPVAIPGYAGSGGAPCPSSAPGPPPPPSAGSSAAVGS